MHVQPYLFFDGRCEEAIEFYKKAVGAKVEMLMRYKESPDQTNIKPGSGDKVMHSTLTIGGDKIHASDGMNEGKPNFQGFSLSIMANSDAEAERCFDALSKGGKVTMPLTKTFFSSKFGMATDRFGVGWMVMVGS